MKVVNLNYNFTNEILNPQIRSIGSFKTNFTLSIHRITTRTVQLSKQDDETLVPTDIPYV